MLSEIVAVTWMRLSLSFTYLWITKQSGLGFPGKAVEGTCQSSEIIVQVCRY